MGVSKEAYEQFLRPTLLVGLFAPPEKISAAAMLETLYFYALAHQNDFGECYRSQASQHAENACNDNCDCRLFVEPRTQSHTTAQP